MTDEMQYVMNQEQWDAVQRLVKVAMGWNEALYSGFPEQKRPDTDADVLRGVADWLDAADDVRDEFLRQHNALPKEEGRAVQQDLRRIADDLDAK